MNINKRNLLLFSFIVSTVILFFGTASSPFYPFNTWNDANCFFTVGKSIFKGNVLYRDIFEQKGLYLYVIYGLGGLISKTSFIGPFLFEIAAMTAFLYYTGKLISYYCNSKSAIFITLPIVLTMFVIGENFEKGGGAEELCMPFFMAFMCHAIEIFDKKGTGITKSKIFVDGLMFSLVFWIKFNIALIFVGAYLVYLIYFLKNKDFSTLWRFILLAIGGFIAGSVPCLIYFAVNNALGDLWFGYFYSNLFLYHQPVVLSSKILNVINYSAIYVKKYTLISLLSIIGLIGFTFKRRKTMGIGKFFVFAMWVFFWYACVVHPNIIYLYYTLPNILFAVFGVVTICELIKTQDSFVKLKVVPIIATALCVVIVFFASNPAFLRKIPKEELAPYQFAQIIKQHKNASVLTYECLDMGIYTLAEVDPPTKYFCRLNLDNYDDMKNELRRLIDEKKVDFIVVLNEKSTPDETLKGYKQILYKEQDLNGVACYHLYQKVDN